MLPGNPAFHNDLHVRAMAPTIALVYYLPGKHTMEKLRAFFGTHRKAYIALCIAAIPVLVVAAFFVIVVETARSMKEITADILDSFREYLLFVYNLARNRNRNRKAKPAEQYTVSEEHPCI